MIKKLAAGTAVVFVFVFIFDWVFHGMLLKGVYSQTPEIWRPESEMSNYMVFMLASQLLFALFMCLEYSRNHQCAGLKGGVLFGVYVGGLFAAMNVGMMCWLPLPSFKLPILWSIGGFIQTISIGVILSLFCGCHKKG